MDGRKSAGDGRASSERGDLENGQLAIVIPTFQMDSCASTQQEVVQLLAGGQVPPFAVWTKNQRAGRGRLDRVWHSSPGKVLALSLGWRTPRKDLSGLSLCLGLAMQSFFEDLSLLIKWPNDLMLDDDKVGGILIETRFAEARTEVIAGIGLNLHSFETFRGIEREPVVEDLVAQLFDYMSRFESSGFSVFQDEFHSVMWKRGEEVKWKLDSQEQWMRLVGVNEHGALVTQQGDEFQLNWNGEIIHV